MKRIQAIFNNSVENIRQDPYLKFILSLTLVFSLFGLWYRTPNFATADEYSRLIQPIEVAGRFAMNPTYDSIKTGVLDGRALGASFYLFSLALAPLFIFIVITGRITEFASLGTITSRWELWHEAPSWFWTSTILSGRLLLAIVATGCVYLMYLIGTEMRDRSVGRYSAVLLSVSFGFISMTHEVGEDIPTIFMFLATIYCLLKYIDTGQDDLFLFSSLFGGLTIAFKLTGGVVVFGIGISLIIRGFYSENDWYSEAIRPKLVGGGLLLGVFSIYIGIPSVLVAGPEELIIRITHTLGQKTALSDGSETSIWISMIKRYLQGLGLPLTVGIFIGAPTSIVVTSRDNSAIRGLTLVVTLLLPYIVVFSTWEYVRMHHLLPTFPLLILLLSISLRWLVEYRESVGRIVLAILIVSSGVFTAAGVTQYAVEPRDQATKWMESNVGEEEEVEVYENSIADVAAVHGDRLQHYPYQEQNATYESNLIINESSYTEWMTSSTERNPEYIQLTTSEMRYLDSDSPHAQKYPKRANHIESLLTEDSDYKIVAEFGTQPTFESTKEGLIYEGIYPEPKQKVRYIVILESESQS